MLQEQLTGALVFILPAYVANAVPVIVKGKKPIDLGKSFLDGKRIFGDGKTLEGFALGALAGFICGILIRHSIQLSLALSFGALFGDLAGAFIKRRLGLKRGAPAPGLVQLDFIIGALVLSSLICPLDLTLALIIIVITPPIHVVTNRIAYMFKLKDIPW